MAKIIALLALCTIAAAYTDVDDHLSIEEMSKNRAKLKMYMNCYLDRGPCTPQQEGYKRHFTEAIGDGCKECNDVERHMLRVFIQVIKDKVPEDLEPFKAKYDPNGRIDSTFAQIKQY